MEEKSREGAISTRTILIAVLIFNVVAIGLSEVQRRALTKDNKELLLDLKQFESHKRDEQALALDRENRLLAEIAARVNHVEILTRTVPDISNRIAEINKRSN